MIDILIPVFNANDKLRSTLDSIFSFPYHDLINVVVVDNCTTDWDSGISTDYPNANFYFNKQNLGRIGNWNQCLTYVTSEFYMFLMAGDRFLGIPERILTNLEPHCAYVFDMKLSQDGRTRDLNKWRKDSDYSCNSMKFISAHLLSAQNPWGPLQTWIFPKSRISRFKESPPSHSDVIYILESIKAVETIHFVKHPIVEWQFFIDRFHAQIDLFNSRCLDFVIMQHNISLLRLERSDFWLALKFIFWSFILWLKYPKFNIFRLSSFVLFQKNDYNEMVKEVFGDRITTCETRSLV